MRSSLTDRFRGQVEEEILAGRLVPGERLDERTLAERFGVSRTPVREALMQLAATGMVEMRQRQGAVVATMNIARLMHMFEVLVLLEVQAARLAARRMTAQERAELEAIHAAAAPLAAAGNVDGFVESNWRFHCAVWIGAHNPVLADQLRALRLRVAPWRRYLLRGRFEISQVEHGQVVAALVAGDEEAAGRAMQQHLAIDSDSFSDFLAALPPSLVAGSAGSPAQD
jgi:DNA-binding GntR family transcriptional regulator